MTFRGAGVVMFGRPTQYHIKHITTDTSMNTFFCGVEIFERISVTLLLRSLGSERHI